MFRALHQLYKFNKFGEVRAKLKSKVEEKRKEHGDSDEAWEWHINELQTLFTTFIIQLSKSRQITIFVDALE